MRGRRAGAGPTWLPFGLAAALATAGCEREETVLAWKPPSEETGRIEVDPPVARLQVRKGSPPEVQPFEAYRVIGERRERITDKVRWSTNRFDIVRVTPDGRAAVIAGYGGEAVIAATDGRDLGTARLLVKLVLAVEQPGLPPGTADQLALGGGDEDPALAPEIVYPADGVLLPPNLGGLEVHFTPRPGAVLHEIAFANDLTDLRVYTRCEPVGDGCVRDVAPDVWKALAETNRSGGRVTLTVRSAAGPGGAAGRSAPLALAIAAEDLRGWLSYWTAARGSSVMRWRVNDPAQARPEKLFGPEAGNTYCVGCHAPSRNGNQILATTGPAGAYGPLVLFDVATKTARRIDRKLQFPSWSPDGSQFVAVAGEASTSGPEDLVLYDGRTGASLGSLPLWGQRGTHPDWAPGGQRIAFTAVDLRGWYFDQLPGMAGISYIEREPAGWSPPRAVVDPAAGRNHYLPAISPDGSQAAYVESVCPTSSTYHQACDADSDPSARIWLTPFPAVAGLRPRRLDNLNRGGVADRGSAELGTSFPRWHPTGFRGPNGRTLYWLTFTSWRRYGLRAPPRGERGNPPSGMLIWMAAVDPALLAEGRDPSFPAFLLPFQDLTTSNHGPQWSTDGR